MSSFDNSEPEDLQDNGETFADPGDIELAYRQALEALDARGPPFDEKTLEHLKSEAKGSPEELEKQFAPRYEIVATGVSVKAG